MISDIRYKLIDKGYVRKYKMKSRKLCLSIFVAFSLLLAGCSLGDSENQITKLDSRYVQNKTTDAPASAQPQEELPADTQSPGETKAPDTETKQEDKKNSDREEENTGDDSTNVESKKKTSSNKTTASQKKKSKKDSSAKRSSSTKKKADSKKSNSRQNNQKNANNNTNSTNNTTSNNQNSAGPSSTDADEDLSGDTCTIAIDCQTILSNMKKLNSSKKSFVPSDGKILKSTKVKIESGDSVYDILNRTCKKYKIHMEAAYTPAYKTYYVEGINQLYEFDCGDLSGWTFKVNGKFPNYGCSKYRVKDGDVIRWSYTCNAGRDVGDDYFD